MEVETGAGRRLGAAGSLWLGSMGVASAPCAMDLRRERERRGGEGAGGGRRLRGGEGSGIGFGDPFIRSKRNFSRPFADERSKMIGLFWA
jgi:hypothetical protein